MGKKKSKNESVPVSAKTKIIIGVVLAAIVVGFFVLIFLEQLGKKKVSIVNNTDKDITSLQVMFETEDDSEMLVSLYDGELKSGARYSGSFEEADFSEVEADLGMYVTFDGEEEIFLYDGYFYDRFEGSVDIEFYQEDGQYRVKMSATTGLFKNTANSAMKDDIYYFDFVNSDWDIVE